MSLGRLSGAVMLLVSLGAPVAWAGADSAFVDQVPATARVKTATAVQAPRQLAELITTARAAVEQAGAANLRVFDPSAADLKLSVKQVGAGNWTVGTVAGPQNAIDILQSGPQNELAIAQDGSGNRASLQQSGSRNQLLLVQTGDLNSLSASQDGSGNAMSLQQTGMSNTMVAVQAGMANTMVAIQTGSGNRLQAYQR